MRVDRIKRLVARQILDSRGNPTLEAEILTECGAYAKASVPSGASTGEYEAHELRDEEKCFNGLGVMKAVTNVNTRISDNLIGKNVFNQAAIDRYLIDADGTDNKSRFGANAILGVSLAVARAAAASANMPLYRYIGGTNAKRLPLPMMNILNGGCHADNTVDLQEFMIAPVGADNFSECVKMGSEIYHSLKKLLKKKGLSTGVGDEGGFAPNVADSAQVLDILMEAVEAAGYKPFDDVKFAIDAAASELYDDTKGIYCFPGESKMQGREITRNAEEMVQYYEELSSKYPIYSIEDGLDENDISGWKLMTYRLGNKLQLVGDDLFVTNTARLKQGINDGIANAILIKYNQIGTLTEALDAIELAKRNAYKTVISHRSGETEDSFIADLAVAVNAGQIKTGAPCRTDRVAKYNQLLRIEEELCKIAIF